jgi:Type I phosphodiesterase / nucleotide pyrophosphatase
MKTVVKTVLTGSILLLALSIAYADSLHTKKHRNAIIFIADGLRPGSVNLTDAPTLLSVRNHGVNFVNSHALFPTFTTPNGSAIATGHYLGDTGDFSNTIYSGYPVFNTGNFGHTTVGTNTPFVENNPILADLDDHYNGNYLTEETLLSVARAHGYNTASIGKVGPVAIQDVTQINPVAGAFPIPVTVFIDDATGTTNGIPLPASVVTALTNAGLPTVTPLRVQPSGTNTTPGTLLPNATQQQYFADATTKAVLPAFKANGNPFVLVYWSRDPDGTQHNQGDSLNTLVPGINGPTSKAGVHNADNNLKQILEFINSNPDLAANTDIFVTADHGFATISKQPVDPNGTSTSSYSTSFIYKDATGRQEVNTGFLPVGFLAIDLGHALGLPIFDPDSTPAGATGVYEPVDPTIPMQTTTVRQHSANGDALLGGSGAVLDSTDAKVIIAANGGSDLIYVPDHDVNRVKQVVAFLAKQDYVGGMFLDDSFGRLPGTLPLSSINLVGNTSLPTPTIALAFKTFATDPNNPLQTAVQIADSGLQQGQGMHGSLGRDNTFNNMAAIGPDFKSHFVDISPVGNADIVPTLAEILGFHLSSSGDLKGRVISEALKGGPFAVFFEKQAFISPRAATGRSTALEFQRVGSRLYFDEACFVTPNPFHFFNPCH